MTSYWPEPPWTVTGPEPSGEVESIISSEQNRVASSRRVPKIHEGVWCVGEIACYHYCQRVSNRASARGSMIIPEAGTRASLVITDEQDDDEEDAQDDEGDSPSGKANEFTVGGQEGVGVILAIGEG